MRQAFAWSGPKPCIHFDISTGGSAPAPTQLEKPRLCLDLLN